MKQKQETFEQTLDDMLGFVKAQLNNLTDEEWAAMECRKAEIEAQKRLPAPVPPEHPNLPILRNCGAQLVEREDGTTAISLYAPNPPTPVDVREAIAKLMASFPANTPDFFNIVAERIVATGMSKERLVDAVNRVIDKHPYREVRVADIIGHDKQLRLYSQGERNCAVLSGKVSDSDKFQLYTRVDGRPYYVLIADLDKLKLSQS